MKLSKPCLLVATIASSSLLLDSHGSAQAVPETHEYSRNGELSPGAQAPTPDAMMAAIDHGSAVSLRATLEYGERVVCQQCVPLLERKLLSSGDARVREMSAWWLRRQPFAGPAVLKTMKQVATSDPSAERRARAVEALGEFMDPHGLEALTTAAKDADVTVRVSAVRALARLNNEGSVPALTGALSDPAVEVRRAALDVLMLVAGLRDFSALLPLLADGDAGVRAHAARLCGELRLASAENTLSAMLTGDPAASARKAAAWALGRIGGATGRATLTQRKNTETDPFVLSAIAVAERMTARTP
jgi:HEAT repeat protein